MCIPLDIVLCPLISSSPALYLVLGSTGLMDPCQKDTVDATSLLTVQERLDLTVSAQVIFCANHFEGVDRLTGRLVGCHLFCLPSVIS